MNTKYFNEDYDKESELDTCRFWLLCKMSYSGIFNKRYDLYLADLMSRLMAFGGTLVSSREEVKRIQLHAYSTIPSSFFDTPSKSIE